MRASAGAGAGTEPSARGETSAQYIRCRSQGQAARSPPGAEDDEATGRTRFSGGAADGGRASVREDHDKLHPDGRLAGARAEPATTGQPKGGQEPLGRDLEQDPGAGARRYAPFQRRGPMKAGLVGRKSSATGSSGDSRRTASPSRPQSLRQRRRARRPRARPGSDRQTRTDARPSRGSVLSSITDRRPRASSSATSRSILPADHSRPGADERTAPRSTPLVPSSTRGAGSRSHPRTGRSTRWARTAVGPASPSPRSSSTSRTRSSDDSGRGARSTRAPGVHRVSDPGRERAPRPGLGQSVFELGLVGVRLGARRGPGSSRAPCARST